MYSSKYLPSNNYYYNATYIPSKYYIHPDEITETETDIYIIVITIIIFFFVFTLLIIVCLLFKKCQKHNAPAPNNDGQIEGAEEDYNNNNHNIAVYGRDVDDTMHPL